MTTSKMSKSIAAEQSQHAIEDMLGRVQRREISKGEAALEIITVCDFWGTSVPDWVRCEIARCWREYKNLRPRSEKLLQEYFSFFNREPIPQPKTLEQVFDIKVKSNRTRQAEVKKSELQDLVYIILSAINLRGHPIDEHAYIVAGKLLGISGGVANRYYQACLRRGMLSVASNIKSKNAPAGQASLLVIPSEDLEVIAKEVDRMYLEQPR